MPTLSAHVPDEWEFKEKFNSVVSAKYRGKPGGYIRDVIERDLAGAGGELTNLAKKVSPESAEEIRQLCELFGISEERLASAMIDATWLQLKRLWLDSKTNAKATADLKELFQGSLNVISTLVLSGHAIQPKAPQLDTLFSSIGVSVKKVSDPDIILADNKNRKEEIIQVKAAKTIHNPEKPAKKKPA